MTKKEFARHLDPRPLTERPLPRDGRERTARNRKRKLARSVTVNLAESPLSWLYARGHLDDRQFDAGEKLRVDWERANLSPNVTMRWDAAPLMANRRSAPDMLNFSEAQIAAKQRFEQAVSFIGKDLSDISWRVICAGERLPVVEKSLGWPGRSGKLVLKIALDRLGDFYRLPG